MIGKITNRNMESAIITAPLHGNNITQIIKGFILLVIALLCFTQVNAQLIPVLTPNGGVRIDGKLSADYPLLITPLAGDWTPYRWGDGTYATSYNNYIFNQFGVAIDPNTSKRFSDAYNDLSDNIFTGSKAWDSPSEWKRTTQKAQGKGDINNAFYHIATDALGADWLFVGSDRRETTGTAYIDFEFYQKAIGEDPNDPTGFITGGQDGGRTVNDVLITLEYSNGGGTANVYVYLWKPDPSGSGFTYILQNSSTIPAYGATNTSNTHVPFGAFGSTTYSTYQFVEAAINMTAIMNQTFSNGECIGVTVESLLIKTKSSVSSTADLKDYIGPKPVQLIFGGAEIAYNPLVVCNYYDKVMPDQNGVSGGTYSVNTSDLKLNEDTGEIDVRKSKPGTYTIYYNYTSYGCDKQVSTEFTVVPVPADKPTIASITQPFCETTTGSLTVENPDPNLTYKIVSEISGSTPISSSNGVFTNIQPGDYRLYSETSYGCLSDTENFEIDAFIDDEDPSFDFVSRNLAFDNEANNCSRLVSISDVQFSDNCPGTTLSWTLTDNDTNTQFDQGNGQIGSYRFPVGKTVLEYTLTDGAGNIKTNKLNVTIDDIEDPIITASAITANAASDSCGATIPMPSASATDNCEIKDLTGIRSDGQPLNAPYPVGVTTITWTAEDLSGNEASEVTQTITVNDNTPPSLTAGDDVTTTTTPGACTASVQIGDAQTSDNCNPTLSWVMTGATTNSGSGQVGTRNFNLGVTTITYTLTDGTNSVEDELIVTVSDNEPPTASNAPNSNYQCISQVPAADPSIIDDEADNCSVPIVSFEGQVSDGNTNPEVLTRTYKVTDAAGNFINVTHTITINDTQDPTASDPAPINVQCTDNIPLPDVDVVTDEADNCSTPTVTHLSDVSDNNTNPERITRSYQVTDDAGNSIIVTQEIIVEDTEDPTITTCPADITNATTDPGVCYATIVLTQPEVTDNCDSTEITNDAPATFPVGTTTVIWTVTDGAGNTATCTQDVTVSDSEAPSITCSGDITTATAAGQSNADVTVPAPSIGDNCGVDTITNDYNNTSDASDNYPLGTTTITWTVTDIHGNTSTCSQDIIVVDQEDPVINCAPTRLESVDAGMCSATVSIPTPSVSDNGGIKSIVNDYTGTDDASGVYPLGTTTVTWTVTDNDDNTSTCTQDIIVQDDEAPTATAPAPLSVECASDIPAANKNVVTNVSDNCFTGSSDAPSVSHIGDVSDDNFNPETITRTYRVTDNGGNSLDVVQIITVEDTTIPVITPKANISVDNDLNNCGAIVNIVPADATDNCSVGTPIGTREDGLALNEAFPVGTTTITWNVSDASGNPAEPKTQTVTVTDTQHPTVTAGSDITQNTDNGLCTARVDIPVATFSDNCNVSISWEMTGVTNASGTGQAGTQTLNKGITTITYTATDSAGLIAEDSMIITVSDNEIPVITPQANISVDNDTDTCGALVNITPASATDNCGLETLTGTRSDGLALTAVFPIGVTTITWNVQDENGNDAVSKTQTVTVTDAQNPSLTAGADFAQDTDTGVCTASVQVPDADINDNCSAELEWEMSGATTGSGTGQAGTQTLNRGITTITYTAKDAANNSVQDAIVITVNDNEKPVITPKDDIVVGNTANLCSASVNIVNADVSDNCGVGTPTGTRGDGLALSDPYPLGITTISWNVQDVNGNIAETKIQTVRVNDTQNPSLTAGADFSQPTDPGLCTASVAIPNASFDDNCNANLSWVMTGATSRSGSGQALTQNLNEGTTVITYTATDGAGNTAQDVMEITVNDNEIPVITPKADIVANVDPNKCSAVIAIEAPEVTDNCGVGAPTGTRSDLLSLTDPFTLGTTTITWRAIDINGNNAVVKTQKVTVNDNEFPTLTVGGNLSQTTDPAVCTADVDVPNVSFDDNCNASISWVMSGATSGSGNDQVGTQTLNIGVTRITYTATDVANNEVTDSIDITVSDNELPVITPKANITRDNDPNSCDALVSIVAADVSDNCGAGAPTGTRSDGLALTDPFPAGITTITWNVTDVNGNSAEPKTQTVTVNDVENPVITTCAADVTVNADSGDCAVDATNVNLGTPTATDNCDTDLTFTNDAPASFPVGTTVVTWTAKDDANNTITCTQNVTVVDNQSPVITSCAADVTVNADSGDCAADATNVNLGTPTATDNCDTDLTFTNDAPASFPVGTTVVTWTAKDDANNTITCTQNVTVVDNQSPVITTCAADVTVNADSGDCAADATNVNLGTPTATDNCDTDLTFTNDAPVSFPVGTTVVTWTAKDDANNTITCTQNVTIVDNQSPVITSCAADVTVNADSGDCAADATNVNLGTPTATDNCDTDLTFTNDAPASFPVGTTVVTWTAKDDANNTITCTQNVTVVDNQSPVITSCAADVTVNADSGDCAADATNVNLGTPTATDNCDTDLTFTNDAPASFPVGTTVVTWTAKDDANNTITCTQNVTVVDNQSPVITSCAADVTVNADSGDCAADATNVNLGTPTATDNCDTDLTFTNDAPASFPVGTTVVTWTAKDDANNTITCTQNVTVVDNQSPVITSCAADVTVNADSGDCAADATNVNLGTPTATDNCDTDLTFTNDAPASFPVGTTVVTWTAKDDANNTITCTQNVTVISTPVAVDDTAITNEDSPVDIGVLGNDTDCDNNIDITSVNVVSNPTNGSISVDQVTGEITYTPNANFEGNDSFTYTVKDLDTQESNLATVSITVNPVNDKPLAVDDINNTDEDVILIVDATNGVLANDSDLDSDPLSVSSFTINGITYPAGTVATVPEEGSLQIDTDGSYIFTPFQDFTGDFPVVVYTISDGSLTDNGLLKLSVNPVNDAPVAVDDKAASNPDVDVIILVLKNDYDVDGDNITIISVTQPTKGESGPQLGSTTINAADNTITFSPPPGVGAKGTYFFEYTIQDPSGLTDIAEVQVTIPHTEIKPEANPDAYTTNEDTPLNIDAAAGLLNNDFDGNNDKLFVHEFGLNDGSGGIVTSVLAGNDLTIPNVGVLNIADDGSFTFDPALNYNGDIPGIVYGIKDGPDLTNSRTDYSTLNIRVRPVNDAPDATDDNFLIDEDETLTGNIISIDNGSGVDTDVDGDLIEIEQFIINGNPTAYLPGETATITSVGSLKIESNGDLTFVPVLNYDGTVPVITYTLTDNALTDTAEVNITITPQNDAPVAKNDVLTLNEGEAKDVNVIANDSDIDGTLDLTSINITTPPSNGTLVDNGDGTIEYTHDGSETTTDSFFYTIMDNNGAVSNTAEVVITINPVNDIPDFSGDDTGSVTEDETDPTLTENGTLIISDGDTNESSFQAGSAVAETGALGQLSILNTGEWTYTVPNSNVQYLGEGDTKIEKFTVTSFDGTEHVITITINGVNDAPIADSSAITVDEESTDNPLGLTAPTDADGDALTIKVTGLPALGTVYLADGTAVAIDQTLSATELENLVYDAPADYKPGDDAGDFTYSVADAIESVFGATDIIIDPVNDAPVAQDDVLTLNEGEAKDVNVIANDSDIDGTLDLTSINITTPPSNGTLVDNGDGTIEYTHDGSETTTDSFFYTIMDNNGAVSNTAEVVITINPVNDIPDFSGDDTGSVTEDETDPTLTENGTLIISDGDTNESSFQAGTAAAETGALGQLSILNTGEWTYTVPNSNVQYLGEGDTKIEKFTVTSFDGTEHVITITINGVNDTPIADSSAITVDEESTDNPLGLTAPTDADGDALTITVTGLPALGTVYLSDGTAVAIDQTISATELENLVYDAPADYDAGDDAGDFTYSVTDAIETVYGTTDINIKPVNDAPVAKDDSANTDEDTDVVVDVLNNDSDVDGDSIAIENTTDPANGTITVNADGTITYTPDADFSGTDSFTYTITDGTLESAPATVTINVGATNDAPIADSSVITVDEESTDTPLGLTAPSDIDGDVLTIKVTDLPALGTVTLSDGTAVVIGQTLSTTELENLVYDAPADYDAGDDAGDFVYSVTDAIETVYGATDININPINDAPVAKDDSAKTDEDTDVIVEVLDNDSDVDGDDLTVTVEPGQEPENGTVTVNTDGTITYSPNDNFNGEDTFSYTVSDGNGGTDTATVTVTVDADNDAPVAKDDTAITDEDIDVIVDVLDNDSDIDGDDLSVSIEPGQEPSNGTVSVNTDGTATYSPNDNFNGDDTFSYTISDGNGGTDTATVTVTVNAINDAPVAVNDNANIDQDSTIEISVLENDSDLDGDNLTVSDLTQPNNGSVSTDGTTVTYIPNESFTGTDTFTYTISDGNGGTDTAVVTVEVSDTEGPSIDCPQPVITDNDAGDCGAIVSFSMPEITDNSGNATIVQTEGPVSGEEFPVGTTTVSFTATDDAGNTTDCSFTVTVNDTEAPVVEEMDDIIVSNDSENCGAIVEFGMVGARDNCGLQSVKITEGFVSGSEFPVGTTTVTYTVTDVNGNTTTESFTVTVNDTEAPEVSCPENIIINTITGEAYAVVTFEDATTTDNCEASVEQTGGPASGSQFPIGTTTVTFTATDAAGNTTECSFTVTVEDNEDPTLECPSPITQNVDAGECGAVVEFTIPQGFDNSGEVSVEQTAGPASGEVFPVGTTTITFTATDASGNTTECSFTVTVNDDEAPIAEDMSNIVVNSDPGVCGAVVEYGVVGAKDNCGLESVEVTEGPASGETFPVGTTTVTYTVTDVNGNTTTESFTVTVNDTEAPEVSCPENIIINTITGEAYAVVTFEDATTTDNCEASVEQTGGPASGSQFPIGTTTVTFTATDAAGNTTECSFTVTVEDNEDPTLECPSPITQNVDAGECGAVVEFTIPQGFDNSGEVSVEQTAGPASGEVFPVGTTTITFTATDASGNTTECSFTVTVNDDEAPVLEEMNDIVVDNDPGRCGAIVEFEMIGAKDNCELSTVEITEGLQSGTEFPVGTNQVTYTVKDINGNVATESFTVTVNDTEAPTIECPQDITMIVEIGTTATVVEYTEIITTDNCDGTTVELTSGLASGEEFPLGTTTVTYTVTDAAGNSTSCNFTVTVEEEELPEVPSAPSASVTTEASCALPFGTITVETMEGLTYSIDGVNYEESGIFTDLEPGTYEVTARDEFGQTSEVTFVTIEAPVATEIETTTIDLCQTDGIYDLFELLIGDVDKSGTWSDAANTGALDDGYIDPAMLEVGEYVFTYNLEGICPSTTEVTVSINNDCVVLPCSLSDIKGSISKVVTPNGDNQNDFFVVDKDVECDFIYDVMIFNRWGAKVFEAENYQNNWDGQSQKSFTSSNQLPAGTYYYFVKMRGSNMEAIQGFIYLGTK
ncbi:HYR domain-containing protein [Christiangramia salexigens]|uniref:HYR domain-containing protein n=1 Tax=Christiangramia salexigens TaxID=1913577 RepID=A0A1L3J2R6_9FLAO|nr:HYR domain-containing protein [Christiangramia salexigens]APG59408.1 hypothetical protein LPB144_02840 [Christiangramia salexigens]